MSLCRKYFDRII